MFVRVIGVRDLYFPLPGIAMLRTAAGCRALLPLQPAWRRSAVSGPQYAAPRMLSAAFQLSGYSPHSRALDCYRSTIAVTPIPPAVQIEISPRPLPRVSSNLATVAR